MKQIISKDDVAKALNDLAAQGKKPTLAVLHAALQHRGSMSTLIRLKAEIDAASQPVMESPEALKTFREVWALAVEEGRNQQQAVITDLRETVKTLSAENDRLDGTAIAAQSRIAELKQALAQAEAEFKNAKSQQERHLSETQTVMIQANAQATEALQSLAKVQAARTTEVSALQNELTATVSKAHDLELKLVRAQALLETRGKNGEKA